MSLYDLVFPDGNKTGRITALWSQVAEPDRLEGLRFRDAWVEVASGKPVIAIYTRNGGGNRDCYCDPEDCENGPTAHCDGCLACKAQATEEHSALLSASDDTFDSTYRTYRFSVDDSDRELVDLLLGVAVPRQDMSEHWRLALDALKQQ